MLYGASKVSAAKLNMDLPQWPAKHGIFDSCVPRHASHVTGLDPHGALHCVMGASLITVSRNDPDVVAVYNGGCVP